MGESPPRSRLCSARPTGDGSSPRSACSSLWPSSVLSPADGSARHRAPRWFPLELAVARQLWSSPPCWPARRRRAASSFCRPRVADPQIVTTNVDDLTVSASLDPARPGPNLVQVRVLDTRRPSPGSVDSVLLRINGADGAVVAERRGVPTDGVIEWSDVGGPESRAHTVCRSKSTRSTMPVSSFVASWPVEPCPSRVPSGGVDARRGRRLPLDWPLCGSCLWPSDGGGSATSGGHCRALRTGHPRR